MSKNTPRHRAQRQVLVDVSGLGQRGLWMVGLTAVVLTVGYIGEPRVPTVPSQGSAIAGHPQSLPTGSATSAPAQLPLAVGPTPAARPASSPAVRLTPKPVPTSTSVTSATNAAKGKPTSMPTSANRPTKSPR